MVNTISYAVLLLSFAIIRATPIDTQNPTDTPPNTVVAPATQLRRDCSYASDAWLEMGGSSNGMPNPNGNKCCGLNGITCSMFRWTRRIISVEWEGKGLDGPLSESLFKLNQLKYLSFRFNSITGSIPDSVRSLTKLRYLYNLTYIESCQVTYWMATSLTRLGISSLLKWCML